MEEATALLSPPGDKKSADQHVDESRQSHHKNKREASFPVSIWPYRFWDEEFLEKLIRECR
jgi:predicted RNA-binding protein